jgi:TatA/E family protein of Tat protein translocase
MIFKRLTLFTGGLEFGFLLFIAFLLFGPKKLPEIARTLGKGMAELRRASNELRSSLEEEVRNLDRAPEGRADTQSHELTGPLPKYGDYHSEPASDDTTTRQ